MSVDISFLGQLIFARANNNIQIMTLATPITSAEVLIGGVTLTRYASNIINDISFPMDDILSSLVAGNEVIDLSYELTVYSGNTPIGYYTRVIRVINGARELVLPPDNGVSGINYSKITVYTGYPDVEQLRVFVNCYDVAVFQPRYVLIDYDGGEAEPVALTAPFGVINFYDLTPGVTKEAAIYVGDVNVETIKINFNDQTCGRLIQWVDRYGMLRNFNFPKYEVSEKTKTDQAISTYVGGTAVEKESKNVEVTVKLNSDLVDQEDANMLSTLAYGRDVKIYEDGRFIPCLVTDGTLQISQDPFQNIAITVHYTRLTPSL